MLSLCNTTVQITFSRGQRDHLSLWKWSWILSSLTQSRWSWLRGFCASFFPPLWNFTNSIVIDLMTQPPEHSHPYISGSKPADTVKLLTLSAVCHLCKWKTICLCCFCLLDPHVGLLVELSRWGNKAAWDGRFGLFGDFWWSLSGLICIM